MPAGLAASTHTYLWTAPVQTALEEIVRAGYQGAELMAAPAHVQLSDGDPHDLTAIREACRRSGTTITGIATGFDANLASPDGSIRAWSVKHYLAAGRLAVALGAAYVVVQPGRRHPFKPAPRDAMRRWVIDGLTEIAAAMHDEGVRPVLKNSPSTILDTAAQCVDIVRAVGTDRIGVCYDVANGMLVENPSDGLRAVAGHLELIHLADTSRPEWRHDPIGAGDGDFIALAALVEDIRYTGPIVVETIHRSETASGLKADRLALHEAGWTSSEAGTSG